MTTTTAAPQDTVRQSGQGGTGSKGNLFVAAALLLALAFLTGLNPANARAATWDAVQSIAKLDGSGLSKTIVKAGDKAQQKAQSQGLVNPSDNSVSRRGQALVASGSVTTISIGKCRPLLDLKSGKMFPQAITYLEKLAKAGFTVEISCIFTGHTWNVAGTNRTSLHFKGQAFDITRVNGQPICDVMVGSVDSHHDTRHCSKPSAASKKLTHWLFAQANSQLPFEVGGPFSTGSRDKSNGGRFFTNTGHQTHFHFGFK